MTEISHQNNNDNHSVEQNMNMVYNIQGLKLFYLYNIINRSSPRLHENKGQSAKNKLTSIL